MELKEGDFIFIKGEDEVWEITRIQNKSFNPHFYIRYESENCTRRKKISIDQIDHIKTNRENILNQIFEC